MTIIVIFNAKKKGKRKKITNKKINPPPLKDASEGRGGAMHQ